MTLQIVIAAKNNITAISFFQKNENSNYEMTPDERQG
jgi:hypothetical protein